MTSSASATSSATPSASPSATPSTTTGTSADGGETGEVAAANGLRPGDVSYLTLAVPELARAQAFYSAVLGWEITPGRVDQGAQVVSCAPMVGLWGGAAAPAPGAHLSYRVQDIDAAVASVRAGGGTATEPVDRGYAQEAQCTDPAGLLFWLHEFGDEPEPSAQPLTAGDIDYISLLVPDGDAARAFYAAVLGWSYENGNPSGTTPRIGMWSGELGGAGHRSYGALLSYAVDDITAAVAAIRAAGGTSAEPEQRPYALQALCSDDQGVEFYLHQYPTS
jgi:predicted enzyme related to lactoylglutathione lyase